MPVLAVAVLVVAVHLATGIGAWTGVGLLSDDHEMVGAAILRHRGDWTLASAFLPEPAGGSTRALYRPFVDLLFWLEQPLYGSEALGYHVTNSLLHCLTAVTWWLLVRRWTGSATAATATAVLFAGWPGHSEATHWIAARTNVMSTCVLSLALLVHDAALVRRDASRWFVLAAGALLGAVAIGTKESAAFVVPVAATMSWMRAADAGSIAARARRAAATASPMVLGAAAWLTWRAHCLGTWGTGSHYGWQAGRIGLDTCVDWLLVLLAPVHHAYAPAWWAWLLMALHLLLLGIAAATLRAAGARVGAAPAACLLALGYVAGIGLEVLDVGTLENVRYTYEPALGLCVLLGLGFAALPTRALVPALAGLVAVHALALDANRQSWLRASSVCANVREQVYELARTTRQPVRVIDVPGVYDGAFGLLNGYTEFLFWQQTAPTGTGLTGAVSSTAEWPAVMRELAAAADRKALAGPTFVVRWPDGALVPFVLDAQWPHEAWPGTVIAYARIARERPFAGTALPVQVLVQTDRELRLRAVAATDGSRWSGDAVRVPAAGKAPVQVFVDLPATLAVDAPVAIALEFAAGDGVRTFPLGVVLPGER